jgi:hypothetical protein
MRAKAKILTVGRIDAGVPVGWVFDCEGKATGISIEDDGTRWGGYSLAELTVLASHPPPTPEDR